MSDDRKKPLWPWIVALLIGLPVMYVASFWPACWLVGNGLGYEHVIGRAYYPLVLATFELPNSARNAVFPEDGNAEKGVLLMGLSVRLLHVSASPASRRGT